MLNTVSTGDSNSKRTPRLHLNRYKASVQRYLMNIAHACIGFFIVKKPSKETSVTTLSNTRKAITAHPPWWHDNNEYSYKPKRPSRNDCLISPRSFLPTYRIIHGSHVPEQLYTFHTAVFSSSALYFWFPFPLVICVPSSSVTALSFCRYPHLADQEYLRMIHRVHSGCPVTATAWYATFLLQSLPTSPLLCQYGTTAAVPPIQFDVYARIFESIVYFVQLNCSYHQVLSYPNSQCTSLYCLIGNTIEPNLFFFKFFFFKFYKCSF